MADKPRREAATPLRPEVEDLTAEIRRSLDFVVSLQAESRKMRSRRRFSRQARRQRRPIDDDGLVLTIGYLVTEAETIWLTRRAAGWFRLTRWRSTRNPDWGLVQALDRLGLPRSRSGDRRKRRSATRW